MSDMGLWSWKRSGVIKAADMTVELETSLKKM